MTYTGEVSPGGPAEVRELPDATIRKVSVSELDNNCYLVTCAVTGEQLLIDAADDAARLLALVREGGGGLATLATTHRHWDHVRALAAVQAATGAVTVAGDLDADALPVVVHRRLAHGDILRVGELSLTCVHLRGHTPGSIAYLLTSLDGSVHAFTGDSLFPGGPGRTDRPRDFSSLMDDLETRVFGPLPDHAWIYPGHGRDSTIGAERPHLESWRRRGW